MKSSLKKIAYMLITFGITVLSLSGEEAGAYCLADANEREAFHAARKLCQDSGGQFVASTERGQSEICYNTVGPDIPFVCLQ